MLIPEIFLHPYLRGVYRLKESKSRVSGAVREMAPLAFVLNLGLELFIIYIYLQQVTLGKKRGNDQGLNKYCNKW